MPKALALLTVLLYLLPAIIGSLWWAALWAQFLRRAPRLDHWETIVSHRRAFKVFVAAAIILGCAGIVSGWHQLAWAQLDTYGLRPVADWAILTLQAP